jgi:cytochrome c-type biogenesis protein CcmH/NrfG
MPQVVPQAVGAENPSKKTITMEFDVPAGGAVQQAQALEKSGQLTAAAATLTDDLRKTPGDAGAWRELGNVYFRMGHKTSAVYCFGAYLRLKPGDQALADWLAKYQAQP